MRGRELAAWRSVRDESGSVLKRARRMYTPASGPLSTVAAMHRVALCHLREPFDAGAALREMERATTLPEVNLKSLWRASRCLLARVGEQPLTMVEEARLHALRRVLEAWSREGEEWISEMFGDA